MCFRRELRSLHSLPSLLCKLAVYAAVELLEQASASLTLETARSRNLAFRTILFAFETHHSVGERNGWKISSFIKLEIESIKCYNAGDVSGYGDASFAENLQRHGRKRTNGSVRGNFADFLPFGFSTRSYTGFPQFIHREKTENFGNAIFL